MSVFSFISVLSIAENCKALKECFAVKWFKNNRVRSKVQKLWNYIENNFDVMATTLVNLKIASSSKQDENHAMF